MPTSAPRQTLLTAAGGIAGAIAAAVAVWLLARYGFGIQIRTPGFGATHPRALNAGLAAAAGAVAGLAGLAATKIIARLATRPRRAWIIASLAALVASLGAPLAGHGVTESQRLVLACMHVAVAAVLIPAFASAMSREQRGEPAATARSAALSAGHQAS